MLAPTRGPYGPKSAPAPTFYRDVLPILQQHCQLCHRPGEIGPMPLVSYAQARAYAARIQKMTTARKMPPWFAVPGIGQWANDPSLTAAQIHTLAAWAEAGAPAGDARQAPPPPHWTRGWNISPPQAVFRLPQPVKLPASGQVEYTYEIVPTGFRHGRWVEQAEIRPSARAHVHHAVVYVRPPGSSWLKNAPLGKAFTPDSLLGGHHSSAALWTTSDILLVYAPGSAPARYGPEMGKYIPAGSDLVFQMHYTTNGHPATDQTRLGLVFDPRPPRQRVITLQLTNDSFIIPPGVRNYRVEVHGTLPGDATLLSFFPHMHLRGKRFEYNLVGRGGRITPLLRVNYNFYWQRSYELAKPMKLKAGTELQAVAWYDNSKHNPHNPDPSVAVRWGDQTSDEMMVGFFDLAVPAQVDKWAYFAERKPGGAGRR
ncbi:MAG TPA: hypothetical protein VMV31_08020 [Terriglobales bacterium]|nr:hypothetical protein [Terriglobales bacterium]